MPALTLGQHQEFFARDFSKLLRYIFDQDCEVRIGEVWRPQEMQELYVRTGRSKTHNSQHTQKMAADLYITQHGNLVTREKMQEFGKYWESLGPLNRWGGSWRGKVESGASHFIDEPHFERKP